MEKTFIKKVANVALIASAAVLMSCNGGGGGGGSYSGGGGSAGGGGGGGGSTFGDYQSPNVTAAQFVNALNDADVASFDDESTLELTIDETVRSSVAGEDEWFVIFDGKWQEYKGISLQYIRSIVYQDFFSSNVALAEEFRAIESDDIANGDINGDFFGDDYEVLDLLDDGFFEGRNSGFLYEDGVETFDGSLLAAESEKAAFMKKAAGIAFTYSIDLEPAMALAILGEKTEAMLGKNKGELTVKDQMALGLDIAALAGVEGEVALAAAAGSAEAGQAILSGIQAKTGLTGSQTKALLGL